MRLVHFAGFLPKVVGVPEKPFHRFQVFPFREQFLQRRN